MGPADLVRQWLTGRNTFDRADLMAAGLGSQTIVNAALQHLVKHGEVARVGRGRYVVKTLWPYGRRKFTPAGERRKADAAEPTAAPAAAPAPAPAQVVPPRTHVPGGTYRAPPAPVRRPGSMDFADVPSVMGRAPGEAAGPAVAPPPAPAHLIDGSVIVDARIGISNPAAHRNVTLVLPVDLWPALVRLAEIIQSARTQGR